MRRVRVWVILALDKRGKKRHIVWGLFSPHKTYYEVLLSIDEHADARDIPCEQVAL